MIATAEPINGHPSNERTQPQVLVRVDPDGRLPKPKGQNRTFYEKVRTMRRDPTVALARWLSVAPVLVSKWSIEAEKDAPIGAKDLVGEIMQPFRSHILETALYGCFDFGWQAYE